MTTSDYAQLIFDVTKEAGVRAANLADACDLAKTLGDERAVLEYYNQMLGINMMLDVMADKMKDYGDD